MPQPHIRQLQSPVLALAYGFGSGLAPKAPGTFGTLLAIPLYLLLQQLPLSFYIIVVLLVCGVGIAICDYAARYLGVHDHPAIVWDEFAGYFITMLAAPCTWQVVIAGFVLFRLFDIAKPWPIGAIDKRVHGGIGIMLDDIVAGLMALLVLQTLLYALPSYMGLA